MGGHLGVATALWCSNTEGPVSYLRPRLRGLHVCRGRHQVGQPGRAVRADRRGEARADTGQGAGPRSLLRRARAGRRAGRGRAGAGQQRHGAGPCRLCGAGRPHTVRRSMGGRSHAAVPGAPTPRASRCACRRDWHVPSAMQDQDFGESGIIEIPLPPIHSARSLVARQAMRTAPLLTRYRAGLALYAAIAYAGALIRSASRAALCGLIVVRNPSQTRARACSRAVTGVCRRLDERSGWRGRRSDRGCCMRGSSLAGRTGRLGTAGVHGRSVGCAVWIPRCSNTKGSAHRARRTCRSAPRGHYLRSRESPVWLTGDRRLCSALPAAAPRFPGQLAAVYSGFCSMAIRSQSM